MNIRTGFFYGIKLNQQQYDLIPDFITNKCALSNEPSELFLTEWSHKETLFNHSIQVIPAEIGEYGNYYSFGVPSSHLLTQAGILQIPNSLQTILSELTDEERITLASLCSYFSVIPNFYAYTEAL